MSIAKVDNKTTFTKRFYRQIALYKLRRSPVVIVFTIIMIIAFYTISITNRDNPNESESWVAILLMLIVFGIIVLVSYLKTMSGYKKSHLATGGKDLIIKTEFGNNKISMTNSMGYNYSHEYKDIIELYSNSKIIAVKFNKKACIYIDPDGFVSASIKEAKNFIEKEAHKSFNK